MTQPTRIYRSDIAHALDIIGVDRKDAVGVEIELDRVQVRRKVRTDSGGLVPDPATGRPRTVTETYEVIPG